MATIADRFWSKVNKTDDCWMWTGDRAGQGGYGQFRAQGYGLDRIRVYAHRWAYEDACGSIPDGFEIDHLCRVRLCVNPVHLEPVTHAENHRRRRGYKTGPYNVGTHCRHGHERTFENTRINANGARVCVQCCRDAVKRSREKKKKLTM